MTVTAPVGASVTPQETMKFTQDDVQAGVAIVGKLGAAGYEPKHRTGLLSTTRIARDIIQRHPNCRELNELLGRMVGGDKQARIGALRVILDAFFAVS